MASGEVLVNLMRPSPGKGERKDTKNIIDTKKKIKKTTLREIENLVKKLMIEDKDNSFFAIKMIRQQNFSI